MLPCSLVSNLAFSNKTLFQYLNERSQMVLSFGHVSSNYILVTFTFRALSSRFYPKRLAIIIFVVVMVTVFLEQKKIV